MKPSWILIILLPFLVAILNLQNAHAVTIYFLKWEITLSVALAIQLVALFGGGLGVALGLRSGRRPSPGHSFESAVAVPPFGDDRDSKSH